MSDITTHAVPQSSDGDITAQVSPTRAPSEQTGYSPALALPKQRPLRLWPGIVLIALMWLAIKVPVLITDHYGDPNWGIPIAMLMFYGMFLGPMVAAVLFSIWWLFFSRLRWWERPLILLSCAAFGAGAYFLYHESIGAFGIIMLALPAVMTAWVAWLLVAFFLSWPIRRAGLLLVILLAWCSFALVRFDGVNGNMKSELSWRWRKTAEELAMAELASRKKSAEAQALTQEKAPDLDPGDWPAFRGPNRDGQLKGVRLATNWAENPPKELWRHRVGPGWGSFTVIGDRFYTQEQRGDKEVVVCYSVKSGDEVWAHEDKTRFTEQVAGPGPRATPTFHDGRIYAFGANGTLNCLDAATGESLWQRDVVADTGAKVPQWGFASSPLVAHGLVSVYAGGPDGKSVVAYDIKTGKPEWTAGEGQLGYCSPQLSKLHGVEQILIATDAGVTAIEPTKGEVLWKHSWQSKDQPRIIQPAVLDGSDVLLGTGLGAGTRRIHVQHSDDGWTEKEVWTTKAIKPYFNDLVIYKDHLYGFDFGGFLTCVSLDDGKGKWRERGYGNGEVLLLADQGLLLIATETGEVALVEAKPDELKELGRFKAFEGKTWNHPVVAHGKLFVRNGEEMACYQLTEVSEK